MPEHIDYFNDLEDYVEKVLNDLDEMIPKVNAELQDAFLELYYQLDKSSVGTIEASVKNLKILNNFKSKISSILEEGSYSEAVNGYLNGFDGSTSYLNDYFGSIVTTFKANDKLYQAILESNVSSTVDSLLGSGINSNFTDSIFDILKSNVTSGSNKIDFINTIKANLNDETGLLSRYVRQVASDSITQFNSNYVSTISGDLGLEYWYYKGTKKGDSRPFCNRLKGKYLTNAQLKQYVDEQSKSNGGKGWQGMVKGENWSNFKIYRGGYNCTDYLIPVSKEIYDAAPDGSKWSS
jgi:hypothetical protein